MTHVFDMRRGQNSYGRFVCPTLAGDPSDEDREPECDQVTQCDRCLRWVCSVHADDDIHECASGIFCRSCGEQCPEPFCEVELP